MRRDIFKDARKVTYLNVVAAERPLRSPVREQTLAAARHYRLARVREQLALHDCAAILLYDPMSIRYALDVSNMPVWFTHNSWHHALICTDGPAIDFSYAGSEHLAAKLDTVDEARTAIPWIYWQAPAQVDQEARRWAAEIADLVRTHGGDNRRLAVDKCEAAGVAALATLGIEVIDGQELMEHARLLKSDDEIELMRWTINVCDAAIHRMYEFTAEAGRSELEIWAELHHENIRNGGEWIETRLLTSGPRTNPWFQETSDRITNAGEMLAFDTDMIGPYGYCADLSRSWTIAHTPPTPAQRDLYAHALDQITHNAALLRPGLTYPQFNEQSWRIPDRFTAMNYGCALHGVGMADEYPSIRTHPSFPGSPYDRDDLGLEPGMVVCVESLIGEDGRGEAVKLETQMLITEKGAEHLEHFPWEAWN